MGRRTAFVLSMVAALACGGPGTEEAELAVEEEVSRPAVGSGRSDEAIVLAELNETCEENWCYGDFNYEFLALECGETTCEISFRAESVGEDVEGSVIFEYDQPLVDEDYLEAGNWERVNDAITDWELAQSGN